MPTLQETLKEFNETQGGTRPAPTPDAPIGDQPQTPPTPAPSTPPANPAPTPAPVVPPANQAATDKKIPDPPFVRQPKDQPNPAATPPVAGQPPAAVEPPAATPDVFVSRLSELTAGKIKSEKEFSGLIQRYSQLEEQVAKGVEPKFADERAKKVHQILTQNAGQEPEAAMRLLRALNFKPEGKSPKDFLFEAYLLDPKNSDLTPLDAQKYFEADYDDKYSDIENNLLKQRNLAQASREAKEAILKTQNEFKVAEQGPAKYDERVVESITGAVKSLEGFKLSFTDNPQETDFLNVAITDERELSALQDEIMNPTEAHNRFLSQFETENGGFDYDGYAGEVYQRNHWREIAQQAHDHGRKLERIAMLNEARNSSDPKQPHQVSNPAPAAGLNFLQTWEQAQKKSA